MTEANSNVLPPEIKKVIPFIALISAVFMAYANTFNNAFLFDDNLMIQLNEYLRSWNTFGHLFTATTTEGAHIAGGFYRPIQNILYFFIYQTDGNEPLLFHFLNITLHAANACLVFWLGRKLNFNPWGAFLAALIWGLHPLHTEVIAYVSGTAEPLFTFFCLCGLIVLLPAFTTRRVFLALPLFVLGLLSKENAVVFPALAVLCLFLISTQRLQPKIYLRTWPLWVIAGIYTVWRMTAPGFDGPQSYDKFYAGHGFSNLKFYGDHFSCRLYTFFATLPDYLRLLVWPTDLHMERSFPVFVSANSIRVWEGIAITVAAAGQMIWGLGRRGLPLSWGLLWFAIAHFPNTGLVFAMNSQFLEHWMYLPSIGLFLGLAETVSVFANHLPELKIKPIIASVAVLGAALFAIRTAEQNTVWHDAFTFYGNIFKYGETSARAHNNLALAYMDRHDYQAAADEFKKAFAITDTYAETRFNYALCLLQQSDQEAHLNEAIASLNRSLEIDPNFYRSWNALAIIYDHTGEHKKAQEYRIKEKAILEKIGILPKPD